ncbi:MAG TPA: sulfite exporter TauE/SafE family protein [Ktedonobacterales bacterium]|nr:sulfite exporter TauE/SafE family protein [Ktedonobacterales bacterium]
MTFPQGVALFIAAILAGALNSVAGGGSFISFPTLLFTGVPSIAANATNTVALWPGSLASIPPYRKDLTHERRELVIFSIISVIGGVLGAIILLGTPQTLFSAMVPWLLLIATLIFAFGNNVAQWLRRRRAQAQDATVGASVAVADETTDEDQGAEGSLTNISRGALITVLIIQFIISLYGGFFGGGIGIMMLAGFALLGMRNIHAMNALKVVLASIINGVAIIAFAIAGKIFWPQALLMVVGSVIGGYGGAALAHLVPPKYVRWFAIAVGLIISAYFFIKQGV